MRAGGTPLYQKRRSAIWNKFMHEVFWASACRDTPLPILLPNELSGRSFQACLAVCQIGYLRKGPVRTYPDRVCRKWSVRYEPDPVSR